MGRIKEAYMTQEEINDQLREKFGFETESHFSILDFCYKRGIGIDDAEGIIMSMDKTEAWELWKGDGSMNHTLIDYDGN